MEILAEAKVNYKYDGLGTYVLVLKVKFNKPKSLFKTSVKRTLCNSWWIGKHYQDNDHFLDDVIHHLSNKHLLEGHVVDMVKKELGLTKQQLKTQSKENEIYKLLDDSKFTVKVKMSE